MPITYLTPLGVPQHAQALRGEPPAGRGAVIDGASVIPIQMQQPDGSFRTLYSGSDPSSAALEPRQDSASQPLSAQPPPATNQAQPPLQYISPGGSVQIPVAASADPPKPVRKVRVRLSNDFMGKITVSVRTVAVSDTCVVLAYPKDADNIVEPPIATTEHPIRVDVSGDTYFCAFGGWTVELEDVFLVILLRIPQDQMELSKEKPVKA